MIISNIIDYSEIAKRREVLNKKIKDFYKKNGSFLYVSSFEKECSEFVQDSSFYYLFGLLDPSLIVYESNNSTVLFEPKYSINRSNWVNIDYSNESLKLLKINEKQNLGSDYLGYSANPFFDKNHIINLINKLENDINSGCFIYLILKDASCDVRFFIESLIKYLPILKDNIIDISDFVATSRREKSRSEIAMIYSACKVAELAHNACVQAINKESREIDVKAAVEFIFSENDCKPAFPSIISGGLNGTVLHSNPTAYEFKKDDLVIVDIGASFKHYCSDVSRTYPVSGKFTKRQKEIYEIVLDVQSSIAALAKPGMYLNNKEFEDKSLNHIAKKMFKSKGLDQYFYHGIGHFVGLDVHDVGDSSQELKMGDVITVEPGLYIKEENIAVRIEDMYWIIENGSFCLTDNLVKDVAEVEDLMKKSRENIVN